MEYNIYDLMDDVRDDTVTPAPGCDEAALRRIKELTMKKIENQQGGRPAVKKTRRVAKGLLIAAIVAVMCTATVAAAKLGVADSFKGYFGDLTEEQKQLMEEMGTTDMQPVTSNGITITPLAVYGDAYNYYIRLLVQAPEGTVLRIPGEGDLMPRGTEEDGILETADYDFSGMGYSVKWEDSTPGDNTLEGVVYLEGQMLSDDAAQWVGETRMRFDDGQPKWLHITRFVLGVGDEYTETVLEGDWRFALPDLSAQAAPIEVDASGLTVESTQPGRMIYLDTFRISSTYIQVKYDSDSIGDFDAPPCEPEGGWALVLDDGAEVAGDDSDVCGGSYNNSHVDLYFRFAAPIDVSRVDYIRFGTLEIRVK